MLPPRLVHVRAQHRCAPSPHDPKYLSQTCFFFPPLPTFNCRLSTLFLSRRLNHPHDRSHHPLKLFRLRFHLLLTRWSHPVISRAPVLVGHAPLGLDPAFHQHALQRRIQRSFFHLQHILRNLLNRSRNLEPVHLPATRQRP